MKLLNTAAGILSAKIARRPFYARFHITYRCNYRCRMCGFHQTDNRNGELSTAQVRAVAVRLAQLGARHVVITGGEPFLRPDLPEAIAAFAGQGFSVRVQTNGGPHVTRERLEACVRAGVHDLSVSLDTLDPSVQDGICGHRGVVDNALRTLRLAAELLPGSMSLANVVASAYNFAELPSLVEHFHDMGVYTYITPVMIAAGLDKRSDQFRFRSGDTTFRLEGVPPDIRDRVIDQLISLRRRGRGLTNSTRFLEDFRQYLASGQCAWRCDSENLCVDVHSNGRVSFCKEKPPLADILAPGFIASYRGREFHQRAAALAENCSGCFYGEYREPYYAAHDLSVLREWARDWFRTFRRGLKFKKRAAPKEHVAARIQATTTRQAPPALNEEPTRGVAGLYRHVTDAAPTGGRRDSALPGR
jgi:sulfatase maturation enzyme AslB (radical SAM superfamily)